MQKILTMMTNSSNLRSSADGWSAEDGDLVKMDKDIGLSPGYVGFYCFQTPMHSIASGWKLLAPPTLMKQYINNIDFYEWWFVRD